MNILVLGAGAIGLVVGGLLAKSGHRVIFLGRNRMIEPINCQGLVLEGIWGTHQVIHVKGYATLSEIKEKEGPGFDLAFLTVKAYDTESVLKEFTETFPTPVPVISLQNGLGNLEQLIKAIGNDKALAGSVHFEAEIPETGKVRVTALYAEEMMVGGVGNGIEYNRVKQFAELFNRAGIPTLPTQEIEKYIWGQVLYHCALNGLGTILEVNYGLLMEHESTRIVISDLVKEVFQVLEKEGKKLDWPDAEAYLQELFGRLIPTTYDHYSSMLRDIQRKKRTEIDAFNGALVKIAHAHGFGVPNNWLITKLVKVKEKIALGIKDVYSEESNLLTPVF